MYLSRVLILAATIGLIVGTLSPTPAFAKSGKSPSCTAVSFRPVPPGMTDGEQDAGLYKFRFAKVEIKAAVKTGEAQNYFMVVNGVRPPALSGPLPKSTDACLRSKHVKVPVTSQQGSCTGSRFRVVVDSTGKKKLIMFFGLKGDDWQMCSATMH